MRYKSIAIFFGMFVASLIIVYFEKKWRTKRHLWCVKYIKLLSFGYYILRDNGIGLNLIRGETSNDCRISVLESCLILSRSEQAPTWYHPKSTQIDILITQAQIWKSSQPLIPYPNFDQTPVWTPLLLELRGLFIGATHRVPHFMAISGHIPLHWV